MASRWQIVRGTNANRTGYTPLEGELIYATDTKRVWVGDGSTAGGVDPFATDPYGDVYNVRLYAATGDGVTDDTAAIQAAIDAAAAAGGGRVLFPDAETYAATDLDITSDYITIDMTAGAKILSSSTSGACIHANNADYLRVMGGRIVGPGKAAAGAAASGDCAAILLVNSTYSVVAGVEVSGFYHGIRPNSGSTDGVFSRLNIHDCAHTGMWPHDRDVIESCHFKNMGTTSLHHGLYFDTSIADGVRLASNHYEGITGYGVHVYVPLGSVNNITCSGEVMDGCGTGYIFAADDVRNICVSGAVISGSVSIDANTGDGIKLLATDSGSVFEGLNISATIRDCDKFGLHCDTAVLNASLFNLSIVGCTDYGVKMSGDNCSGTFVCHGGGSVGFYMNGGTNNLFNISAIGNGNSGVYITGTSTGNVLAVHSSGNTGNGIYLGASAGSNRVVGIASGNSSAQVNNNEATNVLLGLTGAAVGMFINAGTPEAAVTAGIGSICTDVTNGKLYVKATGTGNTGWVVAGTQS